MQNEHDILLVDDNSALRSLLNRRLHRLGWRVASVASAEEALAMLAGDAPPRLLLTDIRMPGRNGFELALAARAHNPALPVTFISGFPGEDTPPVELADCPMLSKPFTAERLMSLLVAQIGPPGA